MRINALALALFVGAGLVACETEPAEQPSPDAAGEPAGQAAEPATEGLQTPEWFVVDHDAETVDIELVAGATSDNNYWNFQGFYGGEGQVTVPEGYTVTINLVNEDPNMGHSVGVDERQASYPTNFSEVDPAFEGAVTENPTSMTESTLPGESESVTFVAESAGDYVLVCYVTGHAAAGMWVPFTVSAEGEAGVGGA